MKRPTHLTRATFGDERVLGDSIFTNALLHGVGASTKRPINQVADKNFLEYYLENKAGTGSTRGLYMRLYHTAAGADGEAVRLFTTVQDVAAANAKGAHISLSFGASGSVTGEGIASRNTLQVPDHALGGGTYAAHEAEIWSDGASSDPSTATELSLFRAVLGGNATGIGKADLKAALISLVGNAIGAGKIMAAQSAAAVTHTLRIFVNGTPYYLMVSDAQ